MVLSQNLFSLLATVVSLYSFVCVARILFSWFPGVQGSSIASVLSTLCDPYLNWFRRFHLGSLPIDFSPILALGCLSIASSVFDRIATVGAISVGIILAMLVQVIWSFVNFIGLLLILLLGARLIANLINKDTFSPFWRSADSFLNPIISKISRLCKVKGGMTYRTELIFSFIVTMASWFALRLLFTLAVQLLVALPF